MAAGDRRDPADQREPQPVIVELGAFALILALVLAGLTTALATAGRLRLSPVLAGAGGGALIASAAATPGGQAPVAGKTRESNIR